MKTIEGIEREEGKDAEEVDIKIFKNNRLYEY